MRNCILDGQLDIVVTCASGVEKVTKKEMERLGYGSLPAVNGEINLKGDIGDVCRLNVNLRTADRVYIRLKEFTATTFDELFDGVYSIRFEDLLPLDAEISVDGKCVKSTLFAVSACQGIVKKAIVNRLLKAYKTGVINETGASYKIEFRIFKDTVQVLVNTSGTGLHKRGYRDLVGIAPIKETLASSMLLLSDYYYLNPFADPFCGSGTIVIEAGMIGKNIAPNKSRPFDFLKWQGFDKKVFGRVIEQAKDNEKNVKLELFASDIDKKAIALATRHAERVGLIKDIKFSVADVKDFSSAYKNGTIVTNPPYGERVYDMKQAISCYENFGKAFRKLDNWSAFVITPVQSFEKHFGFKADRTRKLYNSNKECKFYYYYKEKNK